MVIGRIDRPAAIEHALDAAMDDKVAGDSHGSTAT
jgi:hypothetical protein